MFSLLRSVFLLFVICAQSLEAAKILAIFPTPSISHQFVFRPLVLELVKRSHEVTVLTTDPMYPKGNGPKNLKEIDVHDLSYNNWENTIKKLKGKEDDYVLQITLLFERSASTLDLQLQTPEMKKILRNGKNYYDLLLLEAFNRPLRGIANVFEAPIIQISSFGAVPAQYRALGAPMHILLYPTMTDQRLYNLTLWEKSIKILKHIVLEYLITTTEAYDYSVMRKHFGEDIGTFDELNKNLHMLFINEHPIWADNRPVTPNIIYIGGIHQPPQNELPKELKSFLDQSVNGVIYVSFGTNVLTSSLSPEKVQVMKNVFAKLPYDVIWKWDEDELSEKPNNVKISKWFPQSDLLKHPKVKLFITQGGLQSTDEAIDAAVPVIGIPMIGDQWYNSEKYVLHKIGLVLDMNTLTENLLSEAVETILNNTSYKENIMRLRTLMREYPIKPLDHATWWMEHIMKYGGAHLQPPSRNVHWIDYYEVKLVSIIVATLLCLLIILTVITINIIKLIYRKFYRKTKLKSQ